MRQVPQATISDTRLVEVKAPKSRKVPQVREPRIAHRSLSQIEDAKPRKPHQRTQVFIRHLRIPEHEFVQQSELNERVQ